MKLGSTKISSAVRLALSLGAVLAAGASSAAFAQDAATAAAPTTQDSPSPQKAKALETVVVTGSHIRRVDLETSNPVVTLDRAAIEATGKLTLGDLVQQLPVMTGGNTNPQVNNGGGGGSSSLSLRGLGPNRTLILVDGHRVNNNDSNSIPADMIERIEVLTTGASAVYGSDAIGGVVNFITRKNYQGAQIYTSFGESDQNDGSQQGYGATFGQSTDKGNFYGGIEYNQMDGILSGSRKFSQNSLTLQGDTVTSPHVVLGGSGTGQYGNIRLPKGTAAALGMPKCSSYARNPGSSGTNAATDYHCFGTADRYNYATVNQIETPTERTNAFLSGSYDLSDHVQAYMDGYFNKTNAASQLAPGLYTSGGGADISAASYYNPFGVELGGAGPGSYRGRLVGLGNRRTTNATTSGQVDLGLKGDVNVFGQDWNWDAGFDYGHASTIATLFNLPNQNTLNVAAGPSFLDPASGMVVCGAPGAIVTGCTPFNPFNLQSPGSVAAQKASSTPSTNTSYSSQRIYHLDVNGGLFDLPAGTVQLAAGLSYRQETLSANVDPVLSISPSTGLCALGTQCSAGLKGGFNVSEGYAEALFPIVKDLPFAKSVFVTIGDRYSSYSTFGSTNNFKFALEWRPIADLLLRGTVAQVFRAPNISEVYGPAASNADKLSSDPCNGYKGGGNPACAGVPIDGSFVNQDVASNNQTTVTSSGAKYANFPIKPEVGKTFDLGAVYSPEWLPGATASVDFWHVNLNNTISTLGIQNSLNLCYAGNATYCPLVQRYQSGPLQGELSPQSLEPTGNLGSTSTGGVDFQLLYKLPELSFGRFTVGLNGTYLKYYDQQTAPGLPSNVTYHDAGHFLPFGSGAVGSCPGGSVCLFPRWRANASLTWQDGGWDASWRMRYIGRFENGSNVAAEDTFPVANSGAGNNSIPGVILKYGAYVYNDVQIGYNIAVFNTRVDFGINNVADKKPPMLYANNTLNANSDPSNFDFIGRYFYGRVTVKF